MPLPHMQAPAFALHAHEGVNAPVLGRGHSGMDASAAAPVVKRSSVDVVPGPAQHASGCNGRKPPR